MKKSCALRVILTYLDIQGRSECDVLNHEIKKSAKIQGYGFCLKNTTRDSSTHLKLVDKMNKNEMTPASSVEDTEWTRQTGGRTDGQSETSIPLNFDGEGV